MYPHLARVATTANGLAYNFRPMDVIEMTEQGTDTLIQMRDGRLVVVDDTVATLHTAIDTLWTELTT